MVTIKEAVDNLCKGNISDEERKILDIASSHKQSCKCEYCIKYAELMPKSNGEYRDEN